MKMKNKHIGIGIGAGIVGGIIGYLIAKQKAGYFGVGDRVERMERAQRWKAGRETAGYGAGSTGAGGVPVMPKEVSVYAIRDDVIRY